MNVSIIIPAFNEEKLLPSTLLAITDSAGAFADRGWRWELIVCDNNSTDRTAAVAAEAGAKVVFEPVNQIGRARNCGAAAAAGDWLIFIDADSRPEPALFAAAADAISTGRYVALGAALRLDTRDIFLTCAVSVWNIAGRVFGLLAGSFIAVPACVFREAGGFSPDHFAGEELDLAKRLKVLGRRRGLRIKVLLTPPLLTSARKATLYSRKELARVLWRAAVRPKRTLKDRQACSIWYDGRR
jgi:glycosyltransferase involved in cell wall biosynthesis